MRLQTMFALLLLAGCDQSPPFDLLPLRDALRADPAVIASVSETARMQLASRLESARTKDLTTDELETSEASTPASLVVALDRVRQRRQSEALMVGMLNHGAAWAIRESAVPPDAPGLPPIEGSPAAATAAMETRALEGEAGAALRALLVATGAHHLHRVVGWPAGAVAIDDTVYVNASWLVSLAPTGDDGVDGGAKGVAIDGSFPPGVMAAAGAFNPSVGGGSPDPEGKAPASEVPTEVLRGALTSATQGDAGVRQQPPGTDPPSPTVSDVADACSECAAACDSSGSDSCDTRSDSSDACDSSSDSTDGSSPDACDSNAESTDASSTDACNTTTADSSDSCSGAGDGADAASCQIAHTRGHKSSGIRIWLMAPLAFLLLKRRP